MELYDVKTIEKTDFKSPVSLYMLYFSRNFADVELSKINIFKEECVCGKCKVDNGAICGKEIEVTHYEYRYYFTYKTKIAYFSEMNGRQLKIKDNSIFITKSLMPRFENEPAYSSEDIFIKHKKCDVVISTSLEDIINYFNAPNPWPISGYATRQSIDEQLKLLSKWIK